MFDIIMIPDMFAVSYANVIHLGQLVMIL